MKKLIIVICLLCAAVAFCGCKASPASASAPADITQAPAAGGTTEAPEIAEGSKPMKISILTPDGFTRDNEKSTDTESWYYADVGFLRLACEAAAADTGTPDGFKASILKRLPNEPGAEGFKLVSCEAANFESYPGFIIKWTTGANEDTYHHEAHFMLTDNFIYRIEYAVSAEAADSQAEMMKVFFSHVTLMDAYSK